MAWWTEHVVPRLADRALGTGQVHKRRARVCAGLHGRVLEIGFGSGLNIEHYPFTVDQVDAVEPSGIGWGSAAERVAASTVPIARTGLDGQRLEAADATYDSVLSTFTLCTIPDVQAALREVRRVLRPGGRFHFLEHGLSPDHRVAVWQRRLTPVQRLIAGGCHLDRPMDRIVASAGLELETVTTEYLPGPRPARPFGYVYLGVAGV